MRRNLLLFTALCAFLVIASQAQGVARNVEDPSEGANYVGEKSCKKCHIKLHRSWKKMKHFAAWTDLPEKYYGEKDEKGRSCVSCHVTGYGQADRGGFADIEKSAHLLGVQCEACHGPGSKHIEAASAIMKEKRKKFNAGEKKFIEPKPKSCVDCHNPHFSHRAKYGEG